jgi:spore germination cell wall hydrolase CwlJ-like protein
VRPEASPEASTANVNLRGVQGDSSDAKPPSSETLRLPVVPVGMALQRQQPNHIGATTYGRSNPRQAVARLLWFVLDEVPRLLAVRSGRAVGGTRSRSVGQVKVVARAALLCGIVVVLVLLSRIALTRPSASVASRRVAPQDATPPARSALESHTLLDADTAELAAIVYAEAQSEPVDFNEMLAIASVVRNRVEHVARYPDDRSSFGGSSYHEVVSQPGQFTSYSSDRYESWLKHAWGTEAEQRVAEKAFEAAVQVRTHGAAYPFVFFQQAAVRPSFRAADPPTHLGAHNFWSFRPECVVPNACQP